MEKARWLTDKYICLMLLVFPLWTGFGGYASITRSKYLFFLTVTLAWLLGLLLCFIFRGARPPRFRASAWCAACFMAAAALSALLLRKAPDVARGIARDVLTGVTRRTRPLPWDRVLYRLLLVEHLGSRIFGKHLKASDACIGCGWCAAHCPRGNIAMKNGKPVFSNRCVLCTRCLYGCPVKAITPGFGKFAVLKQGFDLDALEARTQSKTDFPPLEELTKGAGYNGVTKYLL